MQKVVDPAEKQHGVSYYHGYKCDSTCIECLHGIDIAYEKQSCNYSSCVTLPCSRSCKCVTEIDNAPDPFKSSHITWNVGAPVLRCRSSSVLSAELFMTWANPVYPVTYLVELIREDNSLWEPFHLVVEREVVISHLLPQTRYRVRVRGIAEDGQVGLTAPSNWISTPAANHVPGPPGNVSVVMSDIAEEGVIVKVTWTPSPDLPCLYSIFAFPNENSKLVSEETQGKFEAMLSLNFDNVYNISVRAHDSIRDKESNATWVQFQSPSCLKVHHYNLSICRPEAPVFKVRERELQEWKDGQKLYDVLVSWSRPEVDPYYYIATVVVVIPLHAVYKVNATGTATNVTVRHIRLPERYFVTVVACSARGCTKSKTVSRTWNGNNTMEVDAVNEDWVWTTTILVPVISSLLIVGVIILVVLLRKIHIQRENFERERNAQTDSAILPYVYCNDEWEVKMSRLTFGPKLGEGAFGVVNRGFLKLEEGCDNGRNVAIKCLKSDAGQDEIRSFLREMELMKSVGAHPNIVSLLGCCTRPTQLVLVVEYCMHGDLQQYLRSAMEETMYFDPSPHMCGSSLPLNSHRCTQKPCTAKVHKGYVTMSSAVENRMYMAGFEVPRTTLITEELINPPAFLGLDAPTLLSFARQVALGMEFLSRNRVVHRDLAARNVLVGCDLAIKIADFGLSRDVYEQNVYKKKGGGRLPVKWMALESLFLQMYTTKSDVWSFGVLLWEIATLGGNPFPSFSGTKVIEVLKAGHRLECPASCSAYLYQLMRDCWNSNPRKRPTFTEIRNRLDHMLESPSVRGHLDLEQLNDHRRCNTLRSASEVEINVTPD